MILVDSCILIDYSRGRSGAVQFLENLEGPFAVSALTVTEIGAGIRSADEADLFDALFRHCAVLAVDFEIARLAGELVRQFRPSSGVQPIDALIGATALVHDCRLASLNARHFPMIDDLLVPYRA